MTSPGIQLPELKNLPAIVALAAALIGAGSAWAVVETSQTELARRVAKIEQNYETVPERLATIEANQKDQGEAIHRVEGKLDNALK